MGCNLNHHLTQDMPMIPFLYGFQNSVLDEVRSLFFNLNFMAFERYVCSPKLVLMMTTCTM
jgi:hypothetical protein